MFLYIKIRYLKVNGKTFLHFVSTTQLILSSGRKVVERQTRALLNYRPRLPGAAPHVRDRARWHKSPERSANL
jgi:hypothetical protein